MSGTEQYANWRDQGYTPWQAARLMGVTTDPGRAAASLEDQYQAGLAMDGAA